MKNHTKCSPDLLSAQLRLSDRYFRSHQPLPRNIQADQHSQSYRTYASKASTSPTTTATPWIVAAAAAGTGLFGYTYLGNQRNVHAEAAASDKKAFKGGDQGFISLKLVDVSDYNHNTKKFKFALPEDDMVSGLSVACKHIHPPKKKNKP